MSRIPSGGSLPVISRTSCCRRRASGTPRVRMPTNATWSMLRLRSTTSCASRVRQRARSAASRMRRSACRCRCSAMVDSVSALGQKKSPPPATGAEPTTSGPPQCGPETLRSVRMCQVYARTKGIQRSPLPASRDRLKGWRHDTRFHRAASTARGVRPCPSAAGQSDAGRGTECRRLGERPTWWYGCIRARRMCDRRENVSRGTHARRCRRSPPAAGRETAR